MGVKKMGDLTSTVPTLHVQMTELDKLAIFEAGCPPTSAHGLQKATAGPTSKPACHAAMRMGESQVLPKKTVFGQFLGSLFKTILEGRMMKNDRP
jgi:hypothetical protein